MSDIIKCVKCEATNVYEYAGLYTCPDCSHEWSSYGTDDSQNENAANIIRDANGTELKDGDTVTVIKDLKIKGSSSVVKIGTIVKNIRLVDSDHNIDCKIPGIGEMGLKSEFVKKVTG